MTAKPIRQRAASRKRPVLLTDDKKLKREGKVDRASGKAKDKIGEAADKVQEVIRRDDRAAAASRPERS